MSVKLMSMIFQAKIEDVKVGEKTVTAPLLKLVMLALADHCNDDGDGAYPSLTLLEEKTALTRSSVINSLNALKQQGSIIRVGISKRGTTNYSLNIPMLKSFVFQTETPLFASAPGAPPLVHQVYPPSAPGAPDSSFNHTFNHTLINSTGGANIFELYEQNIGLLTPMVADALKAAETEYPPGWIAAAFEEAVKANARNLKYIEAILKRWKVEGFMSPKSKSNKSPGHGKSAKEIGREVVLKLYGK